VAFLYVKALGIVSAKESCLGLLLCHSGGWPSGSAEVRLNWSYHNEEIPQRPASLSLPLRPTHGRLYFPGCDQIVRIALARDIANGNSDAARVLATLADKTAPRETKRQIYAEYRAK